MRVVGAGVAAVFVLLLAAGCADREPTPTPPSSPPASSAPLKVAPVTAGADGQTVRYLGQDGTIRTLPVEDFPR